MFPDIYVLFNLFLFVIFVFLFDVLLYEIPMSLKIVQVRRLYPTTDYWLMDCNKFSKKMIFATLCGTEDWQQTWGTFSFTLSFLINFFFCLWNGYMHLHMYVCVYGLYIRLRTLALSHFRCTHSRRVAFSFVARKQHTTHCERAQTNLFHLIFHF